MASPQPRRRDYAAEYARRQQLARERGFTSYYQQRVRGGALASPRAAKPSGEALARARGHRGRADLLTGLHDGALVSFDPAASERDAKGRWLRIEVVVLGDDGVERRYVVRRPTDRLIRRILDRMDQVGAISSPVYPLTQAFQNARRAA